MTEELFNQLKQEQRENHTPMFSSLLHELELDTILAVREAKTYVEYKGVAIK